jgi:hypothetical protein
MAARELIYLYLTFPFISKMYLMYLIYTFEMYNNATLLLKTSRRNGAILLYNFKFVSWRTSFSIAAGLSGIILRQ